MKFSSAVCGFGDMRAETHTRRRSSHRSRVGAARPRVVRTVDGDAEGTRGDDAGRVDGPVLDVVLALREQSTGPRRRPVIRHYLVQASVDNHAHQQRANRTHHGLPRRCCNLNFNIFQSVLERQRAE